MNTYDAGDLVRISAAFTLNDVAADPTTVTCLVKLRYSNTVPLATYTYAGGTVTKDSTGDYHVDVTPSTEGIWDYRWVATGAVQAAAEGAFNVPDSQFF